MDGARLSGDGQKDYRHARSAALGMSRRTTLTGSRAEMARKAMRENADGATPQNRTGDTVIFSHVLYQLS